jgi:hypothetical protein
MADEVTLVTRAGNEITVSDPGAIGNLIGDGCRIKADPDPAADEPAEAAAAETPEPSPKRAAKLDTPEREASSR